MQTEQQVTEQIETLMDDLHESVNNIIHYYSGMRDELQKGTYTPATALQDYEMLMCLEDVGLVMKCLKDILVLSRNKETDNAQTDVEA